jgi:hypothetical protein
MRLLRSSHAAAAAAVALAVVGIAMIALGVRWRAAPSRAPTARRLSRLAEGSRQLSNARKPAYSLRCCVTFRMAWRQQGSAAFHGTS